MGETFKTIQFSLNEHYAHLSFNRPDSLNALNEEMLREFGKALTIIETAKVPVLFLSGEGRAFSSGGDIKSMLQLNDEEAFHNVMKMIEKVSHTLYKLPAITVSLIHGASAGLGLSLALASDYVLAQKGSKIAMNFIKIGLIPDGGGHVYLEKRLGEFKAKQLIWEGRTYSAEEAISIGLIDDVFTESIEEKLEKEKDRLLKMPLKAMIASKKIFTTMNEQKLKYCLELEEKYQEIMRKSKDHQEGIRAFLEKRAPVFQGK